MKRSERVPKELLLGSIRMAIDEIINRLRAVEADIVSFAETQEAITERDQESA